MPSLDLPCLDTTVFCQKSRFHSVCFCGLLNQLESNTKSSSIRKRRKLNTFTVVSWLGKYNETIRRRGPEAVTLLSCLFPERKPDRVFDLSTTRLENIIQRAKCLGSSRMQDLQSWRTNNSSDFASCVERVMATTYGELSGPHLTVDKLDDILDRVAASSPFSSINLQARVEQKSARSAVTNDLLSGVFRQLPWL